MFVCVNMGFSSLTSRPQVKLTLETGIQSAVDPVMSRSRDTACVSQLVRLLWGEDSIELQMSVAHIPHIIMYLSLKLDSDSPQDEVSHFLLYSLNVL